MMNDIKNELAGQSEVNELNEIETEAVVGGQKIDCGLDILKNYGSNSDYQWNK